MTDGLRPSRLLIGQMKKQATKAPKFWRETARDCALVAEVEVLGPKWKSDWYDLRVRTPPTMPLS